MVLRIMSMELCGYYLRIQIVIGNWDQAKSSNANNCSNCYTAQMVRVRVIMIRAMEEG